VSWGPQNCQKKRKWVDLACLWPFMRVRPCNHILRWTSCIPNVVYPISLSAELSRRPLPTCALLAIVRNALKNVY
jgi:hypothetical protein